MKRHTETVHEEKTQKCVCDLCGKEYSHKSALKDHIAKAHIHISKDDCVTECDICKKSFDQVIKFNNHLVVCSSDPKDFKCRQCDKGGLISESLFTLAKISKNGCQMTHLEHYPSKEKMLRGVIWYLLFGDLGQNEKPYEIKPPLQKTGIQIWPYRNTFLLIMK